MTPPASMVAPPLVQCICSISILHYRCSWFATPSVYRYIPHHAVPDHGLWPSSVSFEDYDMCSRRGFVANVCGNDLQLNASKSEVRSKLIQNLNVRKWYHYHLSSFVCLWTNKRFIYKIHIFIYSYIAGTSIPSAESVKIIGVTIDPCLSFENILPASAVT